MLPAGALSRNIAPSTQSNQHSRARRSCLFTAMSALFAFLHHIAAFAVVATLVVERVLTRGELTPANARRILDADRLFGIAAGVLLVVGLLRVAFFEKGPAYYWHSGPFIAKISLFAIVGLLSI